MTFILEVEKTFKALQGLKSPVRNGQDLPTLYPKDGFDVIMKVGVTFNDDQLNERGWFVDSDKLEEHVENLITQLSGVVWTELFEFRPTFERVASWSFDQLAPVVHQLTYISFYNQTLGVTTTYRKE